MYIAYSYNEEEGVYYFALKHKEVVTATVVSMGYSSFGILNSVVGDARAFAMMNDHEGAMNYDYDTSREVDFELYSKEGFITGVKAINTGTSLATSAAVLEQDIPNILVFGVITVLTDAYLLNINEKEKDELARETAIDIMTPETPKGQVIGIMVKETMKILDKKGK